MRIGITGPQSVGKTTLLNALRSEKIFHEYAICNEVTRRVKSYGLPINEDGTDVTQRLIMNEHVANLLLHENMLTDRTALDGVVYTDYLYKHGKVSIDTVQYATNIFKKVIDEYDIIFYIEPEFDIVEDGTRSTDARFRDEITALFQQNIEMFGIDVVRIGGSVRERLNQVIKAVEGADIVR